MSKLSLTLLSLLLSISCFGGQMEQRKKIENVFNNLRADKLDILDSFYAKDVKFVDPLGTHSGLQSVKDYYAKLYKTVTEIRFETQDLISQEDKHVYVWKMVLKADGIKGGKEVSLEGTSVIKFNSNDLVIYHRDYFDMYEFIYQHIPFVSWVTKKVNQKLK